MTLHLYFSVDSMLRSKISAMLKLQSSMVWGGQEILKMRSGTVFNQVLQSFWRRGRDVRQYSNNFYGVVIQTTIYIQLLPTCLAPTSKPPNPNKLHPSPNLNPSRLSPIGLLYQVHSWCLARVSEAIRGKNRIHGSCWLDNITVRFGVLACWQRWLVQGSYMYTPLLPFHGAKGLRICGFPPRKWMQPVVDKPCWMMSGY